MAKHTELPWVPPLRISCPLLWPDEPDGPRQPMVSVMDAKNKYIFSLPRFDDGEDICNAIVSAVNAHDPILEAPEKVRETLYHCNVRSGFMGCSPPHEWLPHTTITWDGAPNTYTESVVSMVFCRWCLEVRDITPKPEEASSD